MPDADPALREWVRAHQVTWERSPHFEMAGQRMVKVGYDLTLFARHPEPLRHDPGCPECVRVHRALHDVASAALADSRREGGVAITPFEPILAMRSESNWAPEVELKVEVFQSGEVAPSDADEDACVRAMEDRLLRLGARPGRWGR